MTTFHPLLMLLGLFPAFPGSPPLQAPQSVQRQVRVMGTLLTVEVRAADRAQALAASEAAIAAVEATEDCLSTWRTDSELAGLCRAEIGLPQELSPLLGHALERAFFWSRESGGAFDPSLAALVRAWDLRGAGRRPSPAELEAARGACGLEHFESQLPRRLTRLVEGVGLEEGGFGKGAALDAAARALRALGIERATLDLGGQVLVLGSHAPQTFTLAHPDRRHEPVAELTLAGGSCATSGNSERGLQVAGESIGHLLDGRTGQPAPDFGSISVWCPQAIDADCLSTALYALGPERGLRFAAEHEHVEAIFMIRRDHSLQLRATSGLRSKLKALEPQVTILWTPAALPPVPQRPDGQGPEDSH